ncbi:MAG TPA: CARDB domain-containing protein [Gammaproteobacteria bacterium]|nr:CARDB domain-containing protein [Gammaproteobacteria bacterium]
MNLIHSRLGRLTLAVALVFAGAASAQAANYQAKLSASPTSYSGKCPAKITFKGTITANRAGRVQYKFIRSDGAFAPIHTLEFTSPGVKHVSTTWTLGGDKLPSYSGWEAIQIVYPTSLQSNKAHFRIACKGAAKPHLQMNPNMRLKAPIQMLKPEITGYRHSGRCVAKGTRFTILGKHFGSHHGKGVALGGHGIHVDLPVISWNDHQIVATLPNDGRIAGGQWYYVGVEKADHSRWLSNISKNLTVCRGGGASNGKPDLVVRYFGLKQWGECKAHNALMTFQVTVVNRGTAPSPKITSYAMVQVKDQHAINWGNGAFLDAIPPGGSQTVQVPVYYLMSDPAHMTNAAPHPFRAVVDPGNRVSESNEGNNESALIMADPRKICKQ